MSPWLDVLAHGLKQLPYKAAAPFRVPFLNDEDRKNHPVWGVRDATDLSWWNIGVRNSIHNFNNRQPVPFTRKGNKRAQQDWSLEKLDGFQWRLSTAEDDSMVSLRVTWGKARPSKGKKEFYIGWKMDSGTPYVNLTFFQLRVF